MTEYHVSRNGKTLGVYPEPDAKDYYAQGRIAPGDLVWREGMPAWVAAGQVFGPAPQLADEPFSPPVPPTIAAFPAATIQAGAAPAGASSGPPPKLHWALLLLFTLLTLGVFYVVWSFIQAAWVRKIHPASNALTLLSVYLVLVVVGQLVSGASQKDSSEAAAGGMLIIAGTIVDIVASFSVRRSMIDHYNKVEPIGLRLSAALTLFIGAIYLQYHMTRVARWKETGLLPLQ